MRSHWLALLAILPASAAGQMLDVMPGARVRLTAPSHIAGTLVGVVTARKGDSITVTTATPAQYQIALSSVGSLAISNGRSRQRGAMKGTLWGLGIGLPLGALLSIDSTLTVAEDNTTQISKAAFISQYTMGSAAIGAIIGAFVRSESWTGHDFPARFSAGPSGARIGASFRF